jgi:hypothetical protein
MKISKQSLIDWHIADDNGKHMGWIKKESGFYCVIDNVSFRMAVFTAFKDAKNFAKGITA